MSMPVSDARAAALERWSRLAFWAALPLIWAVAVYFMWDAMTTIPSAERLEDSKLVAIPTPRTFFAAVAFSAMELAVIMAALWPWRSELYASRLAVTILVMVTWFIASTRMELSRMDWVHRRWLALTILVLGLGFVALLAYRLARRLLRSSPGAAA